MAAKKIPDLKTIRAKVKNPDRIAAMKEAKSLDLHKNSAFEKLTKKAAELLHAPIALITLVDENEDHIIGQIGLPEEYVEKGSIDAQPSFCELTIAQKDPVIIDDTANHPTLRLFPSVQYSGVRAHLGIPLEYNGQAVGNCCVLDFKPRHWTEEDLEILRKLASVAIEEFKTQPSAKLL